MRYEYTAIPAPTRGEKAKDAKTPTDRYARTLTAELNRMAEDGWDYVRADILPSEERSGLTGRTTIYHNLLIFRKEIFEEAAPAAAADHVPQPEYPAAASPVRDPEPVPKTPAAAAPQPANHVIETPTPQHELSEEATPPAPRTSPDKD